MNERFHPSRTVFGLWSVGIGVEIDLIALGVFPLQSLHIHRVQPIVLAFVGDRAIKIHAVDVGAAVVVEHEASAAHGVGDTFVLLKLTASRYAIFHHIGVEVEIAIGGAHHLVARSVIACGHTQRIFLCHTFVATFAGFEINVRVGEVHFHHTHL